MTREEITEKAKSYQGDKLSFIDGAEWMQACSIPLTSNYKFTKSQELDYVVEEAKNRCPYDKDTKEYDIFIQGYCNGRLDLFENTSTMNIPDTKPMILYTIDNGNN